MGRWERKRGELLFELYIECPAQTDKALTLTCCVNMLLRNLSKLCQHQEKIEFYLLTEYFWVCYKKFQVTSNYWSLWNPPGLNGIFMGASVNYSSNELNVITLHNTELFNLCQNLSVEPELTPCSPGCPYRQQLLNSGQTVLTEDSF